MKCGSQIAVAVVGGYVLGRSKKTRLAALLALMAAGGGKLPIGPEDLLRKSPLGGPLEKLTGDLRGQLVDAGMSVAKKAASNRIDSLSDRLQERADSLRGTGAGKTAEAEEDENDATPLRRRRAEPSRRKREEPGRRERDREEPSRRGRTREPEYDEDEYDDYDRGEDERADYDDDYEDDYEPEPEREDDEPERPRRERRPQARSSRPEPRRRAPRRDDDRPSRGRTAR